MKYRIVRITEIWGTVFAEVDVFNLKSNQTESYRLTIADINKIADKLGYDEHAGGNCLPDWLIDREIDITLIPISEQGHILN